jgi:amino acid transporter
MAQPSLIRALGRWDLTAIGVNQVIGGSIFLMPSLLAASVGAWSPWSFVVVGALSMAIALSFAEAASRFDATGGPSLFARAAFGRFASVEAGWLLWYARASSWASIINGLADALGFYWPALKAGGWRIALIAGVIGAICWINIRGIRQSAFVVNLLTIGKLVPLAIFIGLGAFFIDAGALVPTGGVTWQQASATALLVIFAFGGYEVVSVPAGEAKDPTRAIPFALTTTIVVVTTVMALAQMVAIGTLPGLAASKTPLADAAVLFMGAFGGLLMTAGAAVSMLGNNMGHPLSGSRNLYALAEQGDLPAIFGRVHPAYRTPWFAVVFTSVVALVLALSGSFATLAAGSAVARLVLYAGTCASVLVLRQPRFAGQIGPATFVAPAGALLPVVGILLSLSIIGGATTMQLAVGGIAVAAGGVLFLFAPAKREQGGRGDI